MTEHGFTPGPWFVAEDWDGETVIRDSHHGIVVEAAWMGGSQTELRVSQEDARLIAASPTLLEALEELLAACGNAGADGYVENSIHIDEVRKARAAITLATGEA